jgi:hypothetical protein
MHDYEKMGDFDKRRSVPLTIVPSYGRLKALHYQTRLLHSESDKMDSSNTIVMTQYYHNETEVISSINGQRHQGTHHRHAAYSKRNGDNTLGLHLTCLVLMGGLVSILLRIAMNQ